MEKNLDNMDKPEVEFTGFGKEEAAQRRDVDDLAGKKPQDMSDYQWAMRPNQTEIESKESVASLKEQFSDEYGEDEHDIESFDNFDKIESEAVDIGGSITEKQAVEAYAQRNTPNEIKEIDSREYVDSNAVNPSRDIDDPHFYDGGKSSEAEYTAIAQNIPEVRERLASGESIDVLCRDEKVGDCANAYFKEDKMLTVRDNGDGSYQLINDGNHRLKAAQDLGYEVPVKYEGS